MKQKKKTRNESEGRDKTTTNKWKNKAQLRGEENRRLRKRIKDLVLSRDGIKQKYKLLQSQSAESVLVLGEKASGHQYSLAFVGLLLAMQQYGGMSLRSCRHCISCMLFSLGLSGRIPSHNSIKNWLCKSSIHRIEKSVATSGNYVLYVDESIVFGSEKILLIIGVEENNIPIDRSLKHSDIEVLYVGASDEWKGEDIELAIKKVSEKKTINYVVSDEGNNLRKAYKLLNYSHIEDCTHILANYLKSLYEKDEDFELFRKLIGLLRRDWNLSKENSRYMPPTMRGKMRFANIFPCVKWAEKQLANWSNLSKEVQERLVFLKEKAVFIASLVEVSKAFKIVCETLKEKGFGLTQKSAIITELSALKAEQKTAIFIENCKTYLDLLTTKSQALGLNHLLCSSDIIESFFGKFKAKIGTNNRSGLTEFIFTIANFSQPFSKDEIKNALENIKLNAIKLVKKKSKKI